MRTLLFLGLAALASSAKLEGFNNQQFDGFFYNGHYFDRTGKQLDVQPLPPQPEAPLQQQPPVASQPQESIPLEVGAGDVAGQGALPVGILRDDREGPVGAVFKYVLETEDGTKIEQSGSEGENGTVVITGSYSYVSPDGETISVTYVADETGYHPESDSLPVGPELPDHARQQLEAAQQQGTFDQSQDPQITGRRGRNFWS